MITPDDTEAQHMMLIIKNLKPLCAVSCGQPGDDVDLTESAHVPISVDNVAALDKVLVSLRVIESPDHGPNGWQGSVDGLDCIGTALVGAHSVLVVKRQRFRDREPT